MSAENGINRNPSRPTLAAADLIWLIEQWFEWLDRHRRTDDFDAETVRAYKAKLSYFVAWWDAIGPTVDWRLDARQMEKYEVHLRSLVSERTSKPLSFNTRVMALRRLRQMFLWAFEEGYTPERNYAFLVPAAHGQKPRRKAAALADLQKLLDAAIYSSDPIRDCTLIVFFIGTGCRREEAAALRVEDVRFLRGFAGVALVRGKRTKANPSGEREVAFDAYTGQFLKTLIGELAEGPLFVSRTGEALTGSGVYKICKRLIAAAGLGDKIQACHDLRRAFGHHVTIADPSPAIASMVQRQYGHSSYSQTAEYTLIDAADMAGVIVNPIAKL